MFGQSKLLISRWHLDCIAVDGDFFVGEAVSIRWKKLHINLVSGITGFANQIEHRATVVFKEVFPSEVGPELNWNCPPLMVRGTWEALAPKFEQALFADENQMVQWRCVAPRAKVSLQLGDSRTMSGVGYADHVIVTADKWTVPINEIRFGRYLTDRESFIWIDLAGAFTKPWIWRNGVEQPLGSVSDNIVALEDKHTLGLAHRTMVREGTLGDTVLLSMPALRMLVPRSVASVYECTWRTRAVLLEGTEQADSGYALHQLIRFPTNS
jgi:hypothetical protein